METRLLFINSADRTSNSVSSTDFEIEFFHRELRFHRFRVRKVLIPKLLYNVDANNNVVSFNDGTPLTATLQNGTYRTIDELAAEIVSKMTTESAAGGSSQTFSYSYNSITGFVTITSSGTSSITWTTNLNLAKMMGFTADTAAGTTHTSTQRVNLENRPFYYLTCKQLSDQSITSNQDIENSIQSINAISHSYGSIIEEIYDTHPFHHLGYESVFSRLSFRLVDQTGQILDLNGSEIFIEIECY